MSYVKLFASLFSALFTLMLAYYVVGALVALGIAAGVLLSGYGVSLFLDSRDPVRFDAGFLRDCWTSHSTSNARREVA